MQRLNVQPQVSLAWLGIVHLCPFLLSAGFTSITRLSQWLLDQPYVCSRLSILLSVIASTVPSTTRATLPCVHWQQSFA